MECAGAVSTFAVYLGLITGEEAAQIIREHVAVHPQIVKLLDGQQRTRSRRDTAAE